ncbi:MAG: quinone-dependent dihydroorotate dehydrogenase [Hyphomicrobiales bacterium]|nr:quinone-dependent dihydroorotate dehydrogenase [Hyphomicrobiales bacterium]
MSFSLFDLAQPFLLAVDPERAHDLAIKALSAGIHPRQSAPDPDSLKVRAFGLDFPNPLGMAAGFDKNGEVADALLSIGFGFAEIGTVTPLPQAGNPRPRLFRLAADKAVINRLGFNNDGHAAVLARLERRGGRGIIGVNVGANRDSVDLIADYVSGVTAFAPVASYLTVNVSSPNTPGLRALQSRDRLDALLAMVLAARDAAASGGLPRRPVLLKIDPDMSGKELRDVAAVARARGIDGIIVSNSTVSRPPLKEAKLAQQEGGLSGRPLFALSTRRLAALYRLTEGKIPLIGVGGIDSGSRAYDKIRAGASLVQLYTGLIYGGVGLVAAIKRDLARLLKRDGLSSVQEAVGRDADKWLKEER